VGLEEYQLWSIAIPHSHELLTIVFEICHIVLGLQPLQPKDEGDIVRGWMNRSVSHEWRMLFCFGGKLELHV